ncbi:MAG: RHS repeat-associated core domain-containing protein [Planctomycetaceae bacterium]|nr:RHS repeat-associated core domain-containing protein [Planctomycetaceae bacterium]
MGCKVRSGSLRVAKTEKIDTDDDGTVDTTTRTDYHVDKQNHTGYAQVFAYDAYGVPIGFTLANALTALLYSGEMTDQLTGLQYLRARYYDAATGRFNRLDPFAGNFSDPQSLHKYLYCHGDAVNGVDPSGNMTLIGLGTSMPSGMRTRIQNAGAATQALIRFVSPIYLIPQIGFPTGTAASVFGIRMALALPLIGIETAFRLSYERVLTEMSQLAASLRSVSQVAGEPQGYFLRRQAACIGLARYTEDFVDKRSVGNIVMYALQQTSKLFLDAQLGIVLNFLVPSPSELIFGALQADIAIRAPWFIRILWAMPDWFKALEYVDNFTDNIKNLGLLAPATTAALQAKGYLNKNRHDFDPVVATAGVVLGHEDLMRAIRELRLTVESQADPVDAASHFEQMLVELRGVGVRFQ